MSSPSPSFPNCFPFNAHLPNGCAVVNFAVRPSGLCFVLARSRVWPCPKGDDIQAVAEYVVWRFDPSDGSAHGGEYFPPGRDNRNYSDALRALRERAGETAAVYDTVMRAESIQPDYLYIDESGEDVGCCCFPVARVDVVSFGEGLRAIRVNGRTFLTSFGLVKEVSEEDVNPPILTPNKHDIKAALAILGTEFV